MFEPGTIVLVPFPFTNQTAQKLRPALIISAQDNDYPDVIVLFISSKVPKTTHPHHFKFKTTHPYFAKSGLKSNSLFQCDKIATLDKQIIIGEIGYLPSKVMLQIHKRIKQVLNLK